MNLDNGTRTRLLSYLNRFSEATVLVVGDLMLDEYIFGHASRISPEAPVPVVRAEKRTSGAGGAANVAANVRGLGVAAIVAGVVGDDQAGDAGNVRGRARPVRHRPHGCAGGGGTSHRVHREPGGEPDHRREPRGGWRFHQAGGMKPRGIGFVRRPSRR